jgi:cation transport ATPase
MSRFTPLLRKINDTLDLSPTVKSKILLEIAADIEDLYQFYLAEGFTEKEASIKTDEKFDMSDEVLSQLAAVHESLADKFFHKISEQTRTRFERITIFFVLICIALFSVHAIISTQFLSNAGIFVWPILGVACTATVIYIAKSYSFRVSNDHDIRQLRHGVSSLLILAAIGLATGIFGYCFEMYSAGGYTILPGGAFIALTSLIVPSGFTLERVIEAFVRSASVGMLTTLVTIIVATMWFILMKRITKIEQLQFNNLLS